MKTSGTVMGDSEDQADASEGTVAFASEDDFAHSGLHAFLERATTDGYALSDALQAEARALDERGNEAHAKVFSLVAGLL